MPTYVYECFKCALRFSVMRRSDDRDLPTECPTCSTETSKRRFTGDIALLTGSRRATNTRATDPNVNTETGLGSGDNLFINCSSANNGKGGFVFRGSGRNVMINTRSTNDTVAFDIGDDVTVEDYNTIIE